MSPTSLAQVTPSKKDKEGNKLRETPPDSFLMVLKRRRNYINKLEKIEGSSDTESSEEEDVSVKPKKKIVKILLELKEENGAESEPCSEDDLSCSKKKMAVQNIEKEMAAQNIEKKMAVQKKEENSEKSEKCSEKDGDMDYEENSDESETYSDEEDGDDTDCGKKNLVKKENTVKKRALSAYEKMIEKKKAERLAFLESLKIDEIKAGFFQAVNSIKKPARKIHPKKNYPILPRRQSRRLAMMNNKSIEFSEDSLYQPDIENSESEKKHFIPPEMTFSDALFPEDNYESYVKDNSIQETNSAEKHISYNKSIIKNLTLKDINITKVVPQRITSMSWYPSADNLILAAGNKFGDIGIWNLDSKSSPYNFKIHTRGITCLQFNPYNPTQLLSSSYDGILRCGDMIKQKFNEIYNVSDEACCTYFDCLSSTTYLVALNSGQVTILDKRGGLKPSEKKHTCQANTLIKSVSIHPVNKNLFLTAGHKGIIRLWDLRRLQEYPVAEITHHTKCVNSAFFSPVTGNSILTTSFDDSICIFDCTKQTSNIKLTKLMRHNNNTGKWLSIFRATWLPQSDDLFVVGSVDYSPRAIEVFDKDMNICHLLRPANLTTITSTNVFHPFKPALAGANSSGKVFVFL